MNRASGRYRGAFILASMVVLILSAEGRAQELLSEEDAVQRALAENLDLIAARRMVAEAKGRLSQAGVFPNPELQGHYEDDRSFNNEGEYAFSAGFQQAFPVTGRLSGAENVARIDVALAAAEVQDRERRLRAEVLQTYRTLQVMALKSQYLSTLQQKLSSLLEASERRFKLAEVSETDLNLQRLELERLGFQVAELERSTELLRIQLKRALGAPLSGEVRGVQWRLTPWKFPSSLGELLSRDMGDALRGRPDRVMVALRVNRAAYEQELAKAERWEDWTLGVEYTRERGAFPDPIGDKRDGFLGLSLSVPLPLWNQNEGRIAEAQAAEARAREELAAFDLRALAEAEAARDKVRALLPVLERYEVTSLPLAERNVATVQKNYGEGVLSAPDVLQAQRQLIELRSAQAESILEFTNALTDLELALNTGAPPFRGDLHEH